MKRTRQPSVFSLIPAAVLTMSLVGCSQAPVVKKDGGLAAAPLQPPKFLTISDVHLNHETDTVQYGCDTGQALWAGTLNKLADLLKQEKPQFILYLGDLPAHAEQSSQCPTTTIGADSIHQDIGSVLAGLRKTAEANAVPLLYLPGNNDGYGGDYHSFTYDDTSVTPMRKITPFTLDNAATAKNWPVIDSGKPAGFFGETGDATLGFYSAYPLGQHNPKNLRLLMLNTVIFVSEGEHYIPNDGIQQKNAALQQLAWMEDQLKDAQTKGEAVILAMHVPPGNDGWSGKSYWLTQSLTDMPNGSSVLQAFMGMVEKYQANITGILYSHTHYDELKRLFNSKNEMIELAVSTPGITVQHDNNPGIKIFTYDPANFELLDFKTFYADDPAGTGNFTFSDGLEYSFRSAFGGCAGAASMLACIRNINGTPDTAGEAAILQYMNTIYSVKSTNPNAGNYKNPPALDILSR